MASNNHRFPLDDARGEQKRTPSSLIESVEQRLEQYRYYLTSPLSPRELQEMLEHPLWEVRCAAIERLGKLRDREALTSLRAALEDEHRYVRMAALEALAEIGTTSVIAYLSLKLQDEDREVRETAQHEIERLSQQHIKENTMLQTEQSALPSLPLTSKSNVRKRPLLLVAALVFLLMILSAAGIGYSWWNNVYGNPQIYQTVNQQQTSQGVTITVTKVYADEGRTILAYDMRSPQRYVIAEDDLSGSVPQDKQALFTTECSAPQDGLTHCYQLTQAFQVPEKDTVLHLNWQVTRLMATGVAANGEKAYLNGQWNFSFSVSFHHENRSGLPNPVDSGQRLP